MVAVKVAVFGMLVDNDTIVSSRYHFFIFCAAHREATATIVVIHPFSTLFPEK